ncbi:MAG: FAD binding domain-containing protein [Candidatus Acidiferrales bacterium]
MYLRPATLAQAVQWLSESPAQILAGGTDFFPALGEAPARGPVLDVSAIREIKEIATEAEFIRIGGGVSWTEVIAAPLPRGFGALQSAAREVGSVQIQNRATVAGNLCNASPAADGVPPLLALDAIVELVSASGIRRVALEDFILGNRKTARHPGEILASVLIPRRWQDASSSFLKLGARRYLVISIVMTAVSIIQDSAGRVTAARVAVGSCSAKAHRLLSLERALVGRPAQPGLGRMASADHLLCLSPIDDVRATAAYRNDASLTLVRRAIEDCVKGGSA